MSTPLTALLSRTVRLSTRSAGTHLLRALLAGLVLLTLAMTSTASARFSAAGLYLLGTIAYWSAAFITLAGIGQFCSAITEEKEEQTIGLLRMAGLRPLALLLAKSSARFFDALMLFAVMLPFAMLAVTLGGVAVQQVLACAVALGSYIFLLANLGLVLSVLRPTTQAASGLMVLVLLATQVPPLMFWTVPGFAWLRDCTVWYRLSEILATGYGGDLFALQSVASLVGGVLLFGLALLLFERCVADDEAQAPPRLSARATARLRLFGMSRAPAGLRAVIWKDFHFACGGRAMALIKPVMMGLLIAGALAWYSLMGRGSVVEDGLHTIGVTTQFVALLWLVLEIAMHLSRLFAMEVRWQTLTGLLALPYSARELAYAKLGAALLALLPACGVLGLGILLAPSAFFTGAGEMLGNWGGWTTLAIVLFFWNACAWLSLVLRRGALIAAIGLVIGVQFVHSFVIMLMFSTIGRGGLELFQIIAILVYAVPAVVMHAAIARRMMSKGAQ